MNNFSRLVTVIAFNLLAGHAMAGALDDDFLDNVMVSVEITDVLPDYNIPDIALDAYNFSGITLAGISAECVFRNPGNDYSLSGTTLVKSANVGPRLDADGDDQLSC